jgi:CRP-like cAMP-binding protein
MADGSTLPHNRASAWSVPEVHDPRLSTAAPALPVLNRILAQMPPDAFEHLRPHLERVPIRRRAILQEQHRPIEHVHFIERGVASIFARTRRDGPVEVSLVGRFGLVGVSAVLGAVRSPHRCLMQMDGEALRVPAATLARVMDENPAVRRQFLSYVHVLLVQNAQAVLCNARHEVVERLSRWLLLARDRLDEDAIPVTHEVLSMMLGVRRAGITDALANLERDGAVRRERGSVEIADRAALERRACECYGIIAGEFGRLLETHPGGYTLGS